MSQVDNRRKILKALREELVGPSPDGHDIDCSAEAIEFSKEQSIWEPYKQQASGEEILTAEAPTNRYCVGIVYPQETPMQAEEKDAETPVDTEAPSEAVEMDKEALKRFNEMQANQKAGEMEEGDEDFDLSLANEQRPSCMGVSFVADLSIATELTVELPIKTTARSGNEYVVNGYYTTKDIRGFYKIKNQDKEKGEDYKSTQRSWYLRNQVRVGPLIFPVEGLNGPEFQQLEQKIKFGPLDLAVRVFSRARRDKGDKADGEKIITVSLVNLAKDKPAGTHSLFQACFRARLKAKDSRPAILPYSLRLPSYDEEEESLNLLYRKRKTFAVGHGCAADWEAPVKDRRVHSVSAECLPEFEVENLTPDIVDKDGRTITVSMAELAGLVDGKDGAEDLNRVVRLYEQWINTRDAEIGNLDADLQDRAREHIETCKKCLTRMKVGLRILEEDADAEANLIRRAFKLANRAMMLQAMAKREDVREIEFNEDNNNYVINDPSSAPALDAADAGKQWRAFQIAFLLMNLESTANRPTIGRNTSDDRNTVELIWFPTGGGKTEAYLGLAAFSTFLRRLRNKNDTGVNVIMRYTLRLLTADQFQRASRLICAMDLLRQQNEAELGNASFAIGIWVGKKSTPNRNGGDDGAIALYEELAGDRGKYVRNPFLLEKCPWCAAEMGRYRDELPNDYAYTTPGYREVDGTIKFFCPDRTCPFHVFQTGSHLPVIVIDEEIYKHRPDLIIGTVDKFASIAWWPQTKAIFGIKDAIGEDGERLASPPNLIIQDELHLISGPLGSMTGLYEGVIEYLCTDTRNGAIIPPKIICSTATIRRFEDQIKALYNRNSVTLFPPPGLEISDSFFSVLDRDNKTGETKPGKLYVGVNASALDMLSTEVRTFTCLLQSVFRVGNWVEADAWWTLLVFFNSLRELGSAVSLFQDDINQRLGVLHRRAGYDPIYSRRLLQRPIELTSRLSDEEIPQKLMELKTSLPANWPPQERVAADFCLATNIIEVGVDVGRLNLMTVVGQPKTTSSYIQVTGRVGRQNPGLVVTLYSPSKPRDRSHFEKFISYHQSLYAQVEPTSVTPFAAPVLDRALHAAAVAYIRQKWTRADVGRPFELDEAPLDEAFDFILDRLRDVDVEAETYAEARRDTLIAQLKAWAKNEWGNGAPAPTSQLRSAGSYATDGVKRESWETPWSMRNVDRSGEYDITDYY